MSGFICSMRAVDWGLAIALPYTYSSTLVKLLYFALAVCEAYYGPTALHPLLSLFYSDFFSFDCVRGSLVYAPGKLIHCNNRPRSLALKRYCNLFLSLLRSHLRRLFCDNSVSMGTSRTFKLLVVVRYRL